jgi:radical SAM protein with 4Fe4S-binding SPASM domain
VYERKRLKSIKDMLNGFPKARYEIRKRWEPFMVTNRGGIMNDMAETGPCYYTSYLAMIDWNGDVLPCPHDWNRRVKFGNINNDSLYNIWTSDGFKARRTQLLQSRTISPCNRCNCNGTIRGKEHAEAWCKS